MVAEVHLRKVAKKYRPKGWKVRERAPRHGCDGMAVAHNKAIYCLPIHDLYSLYVYLHEVGHVRSPGHLYPGPCKPDDLDLGWIEEYEAEIYAITTMRAEGLRVARDTLAAARENVAAYFLEKHDLGDLDHPHFLRALKFAFPANWRDHLVR